MRDQQSDTAGPSRHLVGDFTTSAFLMLWWDSSLWRNRRQSGKKSIQTLDVNNYVPLWTTADDFRWFSRVHEGKKQSQHFENQCFTEKSFFSGQFLRCCPLNMCSPADRNGGDRDEKPRMWGVQGIWRACLQGHLLGSQGMVMSVKQRMSFCTAWGLERNP